MTLHKQRTKKGPSVYGFDFDVPTGFTLTFDLHHFNIHGFTDPIEGFPHGPFDFFHLLFAIQTAVLGIQGEKDAELIVDARNRRRFDDVTDLVRRFGF